MKMTVLFFLYNVIVGKRKIGPRADLVKDLFLQAVEDLVWSKTFPWGRFTFEENMKDIWNLVDHFEGGLGSYLGFPSFVILFEVCNLTMDIFFMTVYLLSKCKMKLKPSSMKRFPISELFDCLGETNVGNCVDVFDLEFYLVIKLKCVIFVSYDIESIIVPSPSKDDF